MKYAHPPWGTAISSAANCRAGSPTRCWLALSNVVNKQICVKFLELANSGQFDAASELLHDDAIWWINGDLPSSGTTRGKDAVIKLYKALERFMQLPVKMNYAALTAEEDRVAVEMNGDCKFLDGRPYCTDYTCCTGLRAARSSVAMNISTRNTYPRSFKYG